jgi:S-adenosylmethionine:tRNA ribosyltransferase-isomerase
MHLSEFNFPFDSSLIATEPVLPREQARLLVLQPSDHSLAHRHIIDLPELLMPGDLLVVNDTRVRPARVIGRRRPSGKIVDVLFVKPVSDRHWEVLMKGTWRPGQRIEIDGDSSLTVLSRQASRTMVRIEGTVPISEFFHRYGRMPLPPYIKRLPTDQDREWYQTMFAKDEGAIAAPTAGLHFTPALLTRLAARHIELAKVTLHVGIGTFKPVTADHIEEHQMDAEWIDIGTETVQAIGRTRQAGGKIVAVGTTVVRALESAAREQRDLRPYHGETNLFITPGFDFHVVDTLLTNFHLPQTTLLMLVAAFTGTGFLREAYEEAVRMRYRFYSYGDAMFITSRETSKRVA